MLESSRTELRGRNEVEEGWMKSWVADVGNERQCAVYIAAEL